MAPDPKVLAWTCKINFKPGGLVSKNTDLEPVGCSYDPKVVWEPEDSFSDPEIVSRPGGYP